MKTRWERKLFLFKIQFLTEYGPLSFVEYCPSKIHVYLEIQYVTLLGNCVFARIIS